MTSKVFKPIATRTYFHPSYPTGGHNYRLSLPAISSHTSTYNMPHVRGRAFTTVRKKRRTRRHHYYKKRMIPRAFPSTKVCKMRFVGEDTSYSPAATSGAIDFGINSFYDPMGASGAIHPQYYAEMYAIYKNYKVLGAHWKLYIQNTTADMVQCAHCNTLAAEVPPTSAAGLTECIQRGKPWFLGATDENYTNRRTIVGGWSLKKTLKSKQLRSDKDFGALTGAAPSILYYLHIALNSASNINVKYRVIWDFIVEFHDFRQNAPD
nr:MAG: putative capsid protein [Arizlama virus]